MGKSENWPIGGGTDHDNAPMGQTVGPKPIGPKRNRRTSAKLVFAIGARALIECT